MGGALGRRSCTTYAGGAVAAWLVATTPALLRRGAWGEIDHNAVEVAGALALLSLAVALTAWKAGAATTVSAASFGAAIIVRGELVAALAFASATLFGMGLFGGLTLAAVVVAGAVSVATVVEGRSRAGAFAFALLLAAAALPLFYRLRPPLAEGDPWRIGPVYVLVLALFAAGLGALATANALRIRERGRDLLFGGLALAGGASLLVFSSPANREGLVRGLGFLGSRDPWLSTIDEFQPAWVSPETLRASLPALAAGLVFAAVVLYRKRRDLLPVLLPFAAFCALALLQRRYVPVATAFGAVLAGAAWPLVPRALARTGLAVAILAVLSPLAEMAAATLRNEPAPNVSPSEVAADALVALTPHPGLPPAWGVLAPWDYGHHILARGGRAVALNNFGSFHPGFAEKTALWLEESPAAAVSRLSALKLRYVLAVYPPNVLPGAAVSLGRDAKAYLPDGLSAGRPARYEPTELARRTLLVRLHLEGGAPREGDTPGDLAALARLRMVWESDFGAPGPGGREVAFMKLFEVLPTGSP